MLDHLMRTILNQISAQNNSNQINISLPYLNISDLRIPDILPALTSPFRLFHIQNSLRRVFFSSQLDLLAFFFFFFWIE